MWDAIASLFSTEGFPARWHCGLWSDELGWLHILSDIAIFGAYTAIPCVLASFTIRRRDLPFPRIIWLFVAFIFACGTTHLIEAIIFWHPIYPFAGLVKLLTAVISWATVFALVRIVPQVLHFPGLARLNNELRAEVNERSRIEKALRMSEERLEDLLASERQARADAERANRIKDEFLSTVSHELRTPLNAILGYAQILGMTNDDSETRQGLAVIERNAKAQAKLIDDLLDMSRIMAGKTRLSVTTIDCQQAMHAAIETIQPVADAKGVKVLAELGPEAGHVFADAGRVQQIAWNLLSNAVKFTPSGGHVRVTLRPTDSHIEFCVSDTGEGISPDRLTMIFDRFQQGDSSTTRRHGGLGLGLAIVKQLVELHGGTISAASEGPGHGAKFTFTLPTRALLDPKNGSDTRPDAETRHQVGWDIDLSGVRILVIDDEADSRELMRRLLSQFNANIESASSVDAALDAIKRSLPDVILSDIGMPGKDGYELMRELRKLPESMGGRIPAIAVTAFARPEDRKRALLAGFQAHIAKPIDPTELAIVMANLTGCGTRSESPADRERNTSGG